MVINGQDAHEVAGRSAARAVELSAVGVHAGGRDIIRDLDLEVEPRRIVAVLGPTGIGKSTVLRLIAGLISADAGTVKIFGSTPAAAFDRVAMVFQTPRLLHWRTAQRNVEIGMEMRHIGDPASRAERSRSYLERVGLAHVADQKADSLSGGERQRVALARALAVDPDLILMDEPFSALDVRTREDLLELVLAIWAETGKTIVLVTHSPDEAALLADRVIVLGPPAGQVVADFENPLARPRALGDAALISFRDDLLATVRANQRGDASQDRSQ
jgi:NitT/TauT family transport system ATP-binding protein